MNCHRTTEAAAPCAAAPPVPLVAPHAPPVLPLVGHPDRVRAELRALDPTTERVLITPVTHHGRAARRVLVTDPQGREIPLPALARLAWRLLAAGHPDADWSREHAYYLDSGQLVAVAPPALPVELIGGAA